jgi:hypothetical protein
MEKKSSGNDRWQESANDKRAAPKVRLLADVLL